MTSDVSRVTDFPNLNDISATNREAFSEQAVSGIDEVTRIVPSPSLAHSIPCRLPPELLSAIFLEYVQQDEGFAPFATALVPPWVNVSYVCRYWRSVALNCANLWAHLFFASSEWMDELLRRSKTAPLIIRISLYYLGSNSVWQIRSLEKALGHMERVRELWIDGNHSQDVLDMIHARLTAAAPLLRTLRLFTHEDSEDHTRIRRDTLPGAGLRTLHLKLCHVDWSSPIFNGLTELSLSCVLNDAMESWDGLLLLLSQSPLLRRLFLKNTLPLANITSEDFLINTQNRTKISLCRLEKLTLTDPIPLVTGLLAQFEFPSSTIVRVQCNCNNPEDTSMFLSFMASKFSSHLSLPQSASSPQSILRSLRFHRNDLWETTWTIMCGTSNPANTNTNNITLEGLDSRFPLQIVLTQMDQEVFLGRIIPFLRALPLTHLNAITLHNDVESTFDQNLWMEVFWDAQELRIIEVGYRCANMLIHALQPRDGVIFAPTLTDIGFKEIEFNRGKCRGEESHEYETGCFQCLRNALASRMEAGSVLQRLLLNNCSGILEQDITELSKIVRRVEWDTTEG